MMRFCVLLVWVGLLAACGNRQLASVKRFLSAEDEAVVELMQGLRKNPGDASLLALLPTTYQRAMDSRAAMKGYVLRDNAPGDRWVLWRRQLEASQTITDMVLATPQIAALIANPVQFRDQISEARQQAAEEYYQQAVELLRTGDRLAARQAMEVLLKAEVEMPNYRDIAMLKRKAESLGTLYVVVNPVDYNSFGWNYWGLQNDYLQFQMLRDLNNRSYRLTRFLSDQEARSMRLTPERVVDMRFARLMVSNPYTERETYERSKQITVPATPTRPPADGSTPVAKPPQVITVKARVTVTKRLINGDADLQCRIYDVPTGRNILFDHFPGRYHWVFESANYTGDERALLPEDIRLLNNRFDRYPTREEVGRKLIEDAYTALVRRIEQGVNFEVY